MKGELLRVLKVMSEVTHKMDLNEFAEAAKLDSDDALRGIKELSKIGYLKKANGGYGITEKGKAVLKAQLPVADGLEFKFYSGLGQPTGLSANSLMEFYETTKSVDAESLEFHLYRGDFKKWISSVIKDEELSDELDDAQQSDLKGESLRKRIASVIELHYGPEALS